MSLPEPEATEAVEQERRGESLQAALRQTHVVTGRLQLTLSSVGIEWGGESLVELVVAVVVSVFPSAW